jgi:pimeloyl-ACP methyl ester carboxylesterase
VHTSLAGAFFPFLLLLAWLGLLLYAVILATRLVKAVEQIAIERAPVFFTAGIIERAFHLAEEQGHFTVDAVSPVTAAAAIRSPVLLVHGDADSDTPPDHSRRVLAALAGPRQLILVPGAHHNQSLRPEVWDQIERWLDAVAGPAPLVD